jgi:RNA polymerase sigma-70 factor (ECF subfamily)
VRWNVSGIEPPEPTRLGEVVWLEPYPDALLPEARYEEAENISLAFVTALQLLPPRQRAVLILRDVLGYHAREVADLLDTTVESVTGALKRARATLRNRRPASGAGPVAPPSGSPVEQALVERFVKAYQAGDVDGVVALLTEDVCVSMPPMPFEYVGRDAVARFFAAVIRGGRLYDLVPTRANGQLAFGAYLRGADGVRHGVGLLVLTLAGDRISAVTRFESAVMGWFGLPRSLPG